MAKTKNEAIFPQVEVQYRDDLIDFFTKVRFKDDETGKYFLRKILRSYISSTNTLQTAMSSFLTACHDNMFLSKHHPGAKFADADGNEIELDEEDPCQSDDRTKIMLTRILKINAKTN